MVPLQSELQAPPSNSPSKQCSSFDKPTYVQGPVNSSKSLKEVSRISHFYNDVGRDIFQPNISDTT